MIEIIGHLQAGNAHNARTLAELCGVSRRTIFRDLEVLRQSGVPLEFDESEQCYHLPHTTFLPPTNFTTEEALSLVLLCRQLGGSTGVPFYEAADSAALKLQSTLPTRLRDYLDEVTDAVQMRISPHGRVEQGQAAYRQLLAAVAERRCVRIEYDSIYERTPIQTKLSPYRMLFSRHSWYAIGRSSLHRAVRTFHVGRISQFVVLDEQYELPPRFRLDRYLRNAWHLVPEEGPDSEVAVRFEAHVARNVADVRWHKSQRCEFLEDGRMDFHVTVSGIGEISWWILGYGDQAEVLQPPRLRELLAQRSRRLCERYADHPNGADAVSQQPRTSAEDPPS